MVGEGIMICNNPFLGLYSQMFQRVKECEFRCLQKKKKSRKGFQDALSVKSMQCGVFFSLRCFKAAFAGVSL